MIGREPDYTGFFEGADFEFLLRDPSEQEFGRLAAALPPDALTFISLEGVRQPTPN